MTANKDVARLIEDTLHGRCISGNGTCLTTNEAGLRLIRLGDAVINPIEETILGIDSSPREYEFKQLVGLDYVVGAYLVNTAKFDPARATQFISSLSSETLIRIFMLNLPVFFRKSGEGYNFDVPPPRAFVAFLEEKARYKSTETSEAARRALERLQKHRKK